MLYKNLTNEEQLLNVRLRMHSLKNVAGVLGLVMHVCGGKHDIHQEWKDIEFAVVKNNDYSLAFDYLEKMIEYLRSMPNTVHNELVNGVTERIKLLKSEVIFPDDIVKLTSAMLKGQFLDFIQLVNMFSDGTSIEVVTDASLFDKQIHKLLELNFPTPQYFVPVEFQTVVRNLIANSRKYTRAGDQILVHCEQTGYKVKLRVEDTGIGIPSNEVSLVTEPGYRASNNHRMGHGYGLGLTHAKRFCEHHKGKIDVQSVENKGTQISLEFDLAI